MPTPTYNPLLERLALAVAGGSTVRAAATAAGVSERTARRWVVRPEFDPLVASIRKRIISRAVGKLAKHSVKAADRLAKLITDPNVDIGLRASRGIIADLIALQGHAELSARLAELESLLERHGTNSQA